MLAQHHPAGGYFEFVASDDVVALRCHWPVDLEADDWIDIQNDYHIRSYLQAVDDSMSTGNGEAQGILGGYLRVSSTADGFIIEFSRPQDGWSASSLRLRIRRPITDLLLKRDSLSGPARMSLSHAWQAAPAKHDMLHGGNAQAMIACSGRE
jgi:hypothetical protein